MEETRYSFSEAEYRVLMAKANECADFERRLSEDVANLTASLAAEVTESERLRADLAAALAWGEAMREALEVVLDDLMYKDHERVIDFARAALSTPAPAALDALRRKVRDEALEEAALKVASCAQTHNGRDVDDLASAIRALKEGEG